MTNQGHPTQEQLAKFWEWCGFKWVQESELDDGYIDCEGWESPVEDDLIDGLPELTLNNLFKYAVPNLANYRLYVSKNKSNPFRVELYNNRGTEILIEIDDPALALFRAIWEVINAD